MDGLLSDDQFLMLAAMPGTVVLDARSKDKFEQLHVKGAVNLPSADFTAEALAKVIPTKGTRVLIYCNNNFSDDGEAVPGKFRAVAPSIGTFISLQSYGYTNVHVLEPLVEVKTTKLVFEGSSVDPGPIIEQPGEQKWPPDTKNPELSFVNVVRADDGTISLKPPEKPGEIAIVGAPAFAAWGVQQRPGGGWLVSGKIVSTNTGMPSPQVKLYTGGARLERLVAMSDQIGEVYFALSPQTTPEGKELLPEYLYLDKDSNGWISGSPEPVERLGREFRRYKLNYP